MRTQVSTFDCKSKIDVVSTFYSKSYWSVALSRFALSRFDRIIAILVSDERILLRLEIIIISYVFEY